MVTLLRICRRIQVPILYFFFLFLIEGLLKPWFKGCVVSIVKLIVNLTGPWSSPLMKNNQEKPHRLEIFIVFDAGIICVSLFIPSENRLSDHT